MATISSHTLNGVDGTHAGGIRVQVHECASGKVLFDSRTDDGGRLSEEVDISAASPDATYEMMFETGPYWQARDVARKTPQIMTEVVVRFQMPDPGARYHIPVILSPNSYSVWWSS
jgi:5-hydroxyisourate hydrolase-like protein (transthyretin family)